MTIGGKVPRARSGQGVGILSFGLVWDFFPRDFREFECHVTNWV